MAVAAVVLETTPDREGHGSMPPRGVASGRGAGRIRKFKTVLLVVHMLAVASQSSSSRA